ncbi:MAG: hypothetical protein EON59_02985 [Alphaproteobacteria bacterium]|nr:MAG: hypothetical protein EON59_02985 [Alphaproteobacteria bacterium]
MLARLEALYLNILRVVILVLATILLVGAIGAIVVAGPMLLSSFQGETNAGRLVRADDLASFERGQSGSGESASSDQPTAETLERAQQADSRLRSAARNIAAYVRAKQGFAPVEPAIVGYLEDNAYSLPSALFDRYCDSLLALTKDLSARPATAPVVDVDQLTAWHLQRFQAAAEQASAQDAAKAAEATQRRITAVLAATAAATLFGLFLLMVFVFVLVKIERNLRFESTNAVASKLKASLEAG